MKNGWDSKNIVGKKVVSIYPDKTNTSVTSMEIVFDDGSKLSFETGHCIDVTYQTEREMALEVLKRLTPEEKVLIEKYWRAK